MRPAFSLYALPVRTRALAAAGLVGLVLAACSPVVKKHGYVAPEETFDAVEVGKSTRDDVAATLGSPSSVNAFGDETWYYIYGMTETTAFLDPELKEQRVVAIAFDEDGTVKEVVRYGIDERWDLEPVQRETPTYGKELGLLQQLLGNIGRFNKPESGAKY